MGLKQMYSNQDAEGRNFFYKNYFNLDPAADAQGMWNLLAYYVYGLRFVYEYYFVGLASWSWYYPYYFAPLLADITNYLSISLQNNQTFSAFDRGEPFPPFKQLLCILPKESAELLPSSFQKLLLEPESPLRVPLDYYPD